MTAWSVGELAISIEEKKIAKGVRASNQVFATQCKQCGTQIGGPFGVEFEGLARGGVAECQSRRVERLPGRGALQRLGRASRGARDAPAPPAPVDRIADDRVSDQLEVDPDLVGAAGVKLQPKQVRHAEAGHDEGVGPRRPARRA